MFNAIMLVIGWMLLAAFGLLIYAGTVLHEPRNATSHSKRIFDYVLGLVFWVTIYFCFEGFPRFSWLSATYYIFAAATSGPFMLAVVGILRGLSRKSVRQWLASLLYNSPLFRTSAALAIITAGLYGTDIGRSYLLPSFCVLAFLIFAVAIAFLNIISNRIFSVDPKKAPTRVWELSVARPGATFFLIWLLVFYIPLVYARMYSIIGLKGPDRVTTDVSDALYFSVITWTTLGYGDIVPPKGIGRFLAGSEALLGYLVMALLISAFTSVATIMARRADKANETLSKSAATDSDASVV